MAEQSGEGPVFKDGVIQVKKTYDTGESSNKAPKPVSFALEMKNLPLYEQAANQTGYKVSVKAKEGENFTFSSTEQEIKTHIHDGLVELREGDISDSNFDRTAKIAPVMVGISIEAPEGKKDYTEFWKTYEALKQPPSLDHT